MELETVFSAEAGEDGIYYATVNISDHELLRDFKYHLSEAALELDILIGVNDIEGGVQLGFSDPKHYQHAMQIVDPKLAESAAIVKDRDAALLRASERAGGCLVNKGNNEDDDYLYRNQDRDLTR